MNKFLIIVILGTFSACSTDNSLADGKMIPILEPTMHEEPYNDGSGLVRVTTYGAGKVILEQGNYLNGYREGVYIEYHVNGFIKSSVGYIQGKKEGQYLLIDDKGQVQERSSYHQDVLNGPRVKYNRSRVKETSQYSNGELHGLLEKFYPNAKIMERSYYNSGQLDGVARWYDQAGSNTIAYEYKMGELIGDVELEFATPPTPVK